MTTPLRSLQAPVHELPRRFTFSSSLGGKSAEKSGEFSCMDCLLEPCHSSSMCFFDCTCKALVSSQFCLSAKLLVKQVPDDFGRISCDL